MHDLAILGSAGYLGSHFVRGIEGKGWRVLGLSRKEVDYSNVEDLSAWLRENKPDFLINAAGYTGKPNVDACEDEKCECLFGNAVLPGRIREVCEEYKIPWGHVSSGCIYSGSRADGMGWREEDAPNFCFRQPPRSFYSGTKALGEEVLDGAKNCYVWRLRIPFNDESNPRNYLQKLLRYENLLDAENSISHLSEFVESCLKCFEFGIEPGIYNLTNRGSVTTRQITNWMLEEGITDKEFSFFKDEADFMGRAASTPRSNCVLDTTKAEKAGVGMRPVEDAVRDALRKMKRGCLV
jgi:dTDP-4-dehydrorhamnose reductase